MNPEPWPRERLLYELLCGEIQRASWLEANLHYLGTLVREKVRPAYWSRYVKDSPRLIEEARLSFLRCEEVAPLGLDLPVRLCDRLRQQ
ncbi:MAG: hypothetical protein A3G35_05880 [candidate division NC10 bacterium RIFCSPLOWO2_12_FULL_66_18]|nr:MAG: hypothetical protein A3H39_12750 [candidate division NC10 bacterium RIFCSPLOWO2_02_FULL_66_22]OGC02079.1 MAG: hypothetical protein A3G35_05880 [candidate division NC10 bacterium RIFCSPLOWO2_12_FULL_66_18]